MLDLHSDITDVARRILPRSRTTSRGTRQQSTLRGFVAELVYKPNDGVLGAINSIQNRLTTVPAYLGKYTPGSLATIQRAATQASNVGN